MIWFAETGITPDIGKRLQRRYQAATRETIEKDPYSPIGRVPRYAFKTADRIANRLGMAPDSVPRIKGGTQAGGKQHLLRLSLVGTIFLSASSCALTFAL